MSTTSSTFWSNLKQFLPIVEMAGNVALLATGVGVGFEPLVAGLENAANPLLQQIGTGQPTTTTILAVYATIIGTLTTLKALPNLPQATLSEIESYIEAAQAGTAAYVQAQAGFNPANYQPVAPIS